MTTTFKKESSVINRKEELVFEHFLFERKYFSNFEKCPKNYNEYKLSFPKFPIFAYSYIDKGELVSLRLLMQINEYQLHTMIILLDEKIRGNGISKEIILAQNIMVKELGFKYISEFTDIPELSKTINSNTITSYIKYCPDNSFLYQKLVRNIMKKNIETNRLSSEFMTCKDYYKMNDKTSKDACFLIFNIK